ncbi:transporter substrate-binding domain-containing protein, partial [Acinetobacter baumannii]|nr:transporter substrate-binding domain-containing protein [Acinetobacter baumannii]
EWVHVQLHQQKGMISLSPPTICNSAVEFPNIDNAYLDLQAGNLDAVVHDSPNVLYYVKTAGGGKVKSTGETDSILPQKYGFALQKNSSLTPKVDAALKALRADGTYDKIYFKWFNKQPK